MSEGRFISAEEMLAEAVAAAQASGLTVTDPYALLGLSSPSPPEWGREFMPYLQCSQDDVPPEDVFVVPVWADDIPSDYRSALMTAKPHLAQRMYPAVMERVANHEEFPLAATWYIPPAAHLLEFVFWWTTLIIVRRAMLRTKWRVWHPAGESNSRWGWVFDKVVGLLVTAVYPAAAAYKLAVGEAAFMLQPCQMANVLLIALAIAPKRSRIAGLAFNIYLHNLFGMLMSIVDPDLSAEDMPFEAEVHFLQHVLLGVVPLYYIFRRRYPIYHRRDIFGVVWMDVYHWCVLFPLAAPLNANLNYMMAPPRRSAWLIGGAMYRLATGFIASPVNLLTYEGWVAPTVRLVHAFDSSKSRWARAIPAVSLVLFVCGCMAACEAYLQFLYGESRVSLVQSLVMGTPREMGQQRRVAGAGRTRSGLC